jgi:hypothetical protein
MASSSGGLSEALEGLERFGVRRIALENLMVALDGVFRIPHLRFAERRETEHQPDLLFFALGEAEARLEVLGELRPHALPHEQRLESAEGHVARRVEREHLAVRGRRLVRLADLSSYTPAIWA